MVVPLTAVAVVLDVLYLGTRVEMNNDANERAAVVQGACKDRFLFGRWLRGVLRGLLLDQSFTFSIILGPS